MDMIVGTRRQLAIALTKWLLSTLLIAATTACSPYIYPTVTDYCPSDTGQTPTNDVASSVKATPVSCSELPTVASAVSGLKKSSRSVEQHIDTQVYASRAMDVATFGLATGFAFKVMQGGSLATNGAKNLALSAGATYTAGSLFFPRANEALYLNADLALVCIANRGNGLLTAYDQALGGLKKGQPGVEGDNSGKDCGSDWTNLQTELAKAQAARDAAKTSEADFATKLTDAGNNVLVTLAQQLFAQYPSPEAILNSGKSAIASATALVPRPPSGTVSQFSADKCNADTLARVAAATTTYKAISSTLTQRMNAIGDLTQGCAATVANPAQPLKVSQTEVTLHGGDSGFVLSIEGGRTPIRPQWTGGEPGNNASFNWVVQDRLLRLSAPSGAAEQTYNLQLVDASVVPTPVEVKVITKSK